MCIDDGVTESMTRKTSDDVVMIYKKGGLGENIWTKEHRGHEGRETRHIRLQTHQVTDNIGGENRQGDDRVLLTSSSGYSENSVSRKAAVSNFGKCTLKIRNGGNVVFYDPSLEGPGRCRRPQSF